MTATTDVCDLHTLAVVSTVAAGSTSDVATPPHHHDRDTAATDSGGVATKEDSWPDRCIDIMCTPTTIIERLVHQHPIMTESKRARLEQTLERDIVNFASRMVDGKRVVNLIQQLTDKGALPKLLEFFHWNETFAPLSQVTKTMQKRIELRHAQTTKEFEFDLADAPLFNADERFNQMMASCANLFKKTPHLIVRDADVLLGRRWLPKWQRLLQAFPARTHVHMAFETSYFQGVREWFYDDKQYNEMEEVDWKQLLTPHLVSLEWMEHLKEVGDGNLIRNRGDHHAWSVYGPDDFTALEICRTTSSTMVEPASEPRRFPYGPNLRVLDVEWTTLGSTRILPNVQALTKHCPKLDTLRLRFFSHRGRHEPFDEKNEALEHVCKAYAETLVDFEWRQLSNISTKVVTFDAAALQMLDVCTKLQHVYVDLEGHADKAEWARTMERFCKRHPGLQSLKLHVKNGPSFDDDNVLVSVATHCPDMRELDYLRDSGSTADEKTWSSCLAALPKLRSLPPWSKSDWTGELKLPVTLQQLWLDECRVRSLANLLSLSAMRQLRITGEVVCDTATLTSLARAMPQLVDLHLVSDRVHLEDQGLLAVANHCVDMETVSILCTNRNVGVGPASSLSGAPVHAFLRRRPFRVLVVNLPSCERRWRQEEFATVQRVVYVELMDSVLIRPLGAKPIDRVKGAIAKTDWARFRHFR